MVHPETADNTGCRTSVVHPQTANNTGCRNLLIHSSPNFFSKLKCGLCYSPHWIQWRCQPVQLPVSSHVIKKTHFFRGSFASPNLFTTWSVKTAAVSIYGSEQIPKVHQHRPQRSLWKSPMLMIHTHNTSSHTVNQIFPYCQSYLPIRSIIYLPSLSYLPMLPDLL